MTPLFTIATVTYNSSKWVRLAIESVLASGYTDFEYIISDDCSTDDTWNVIQSYTDSRIKAFRHDTNIGEYQNRNFALSKAIGEYILFVDGDDELYPGTLEKLSKYIAEYPGAGSIWGIPKHISDLPDLPLYLKPEETISWIYLANIWIAFVGFADTLFKTRQLKLMGGFPTIYISGDTYIKKRIAIETPVLLVEPGMVYWRRSPAQASIKLSNNYNGFINNVMIDNEIIQELKSKNLNVKIVQIEENIRIRNIKLLLKHSFRKGRIFDGLRLFKKLKFSVADIKFLFKKGKYDYIK